MRGEKAKVQSERGDDFWSVQIWFRSPKIFFKIKIIYFFNNMGHHREIEALLGHNSVPSSLHSSSSWNVSSQTFQLFDQFSPHSKHAPEVVSIKIVPTPTSVTVRDVLFRRTGQALPSAANFSHPESLLYRGEVKSLAYRERVSTECFSNEFSIRFSSIFSGGQGTGPVLLLH